MLNPTKYKDFGLLALRVGIGISFIFHGYPKLMGGPEMWAGLGSNMQHVGIDFAPKFWGFMAAFSECVGGLLFALGALVPIVSAMLCFTMIIATIMHIKMGDSFIDYSHPMEAAIVFFSFIFIGSGKYAVKGPL